ncbi:hypothetical protein [uncultured Subdoligranulum sp.]|uniref:hypothetical protein n=1 Tax=uncultured Subdoligranulum sp. TaxID=512298 RepID=UPI00262D85DE|nr:hypothetical protein [uncultured Subdoligranulum sp.]
MWIYYLVIAVVEALGLWAAWMSGRDVERRNAARMAEEEQEPTLMLKIETKGDQKDGVPTDEYPRPVCGADPVRKENTGDPQNGPQGDA